MHIDEYFLNEYIHDNSEYTDVKKIIEHILLTFLRTTEISKAPQFLDPNDLDSKNFTAIEGKINFSSWPYKLTSSKGIQEYYSSSTASMILYALQKIIDIKAFSGRRAQKNTLLSSLSEKEYDDFIKLWKSELLVLLDRAKNLKLYSSTFGENNVFTLGWTIGVLDYYKEAAIEAELVDIEIARDKIRVEAFKKIKLYFTNPANPENIDSFFGTLDPTKKSKKTFLEHAFHTLRAIHIFFKLTDLDLESEVKSNVNEKVKTYFLSKIHDHLSYSEIANSNFDPSELVFALEGVLRIDTELNLKSIDYNLVNRIFKVIENSQNKNPYWRPLKPFVTTSQGMVLFPLSIEIANSLLRICELLERQNKFYFSEYLGLFKKYTDWLKSRQVVVHIEGIPVYGWHSEHVNDPKIIHPWETAQVLHFLVKYSSMIQQHIARKCLKLSNLQSKSPKKRKQKDQHIYWKTKIADFDPVQFDNGNIESEQQLFYKIGQQYILPRIKNLNQEALCSMLLYGPPGTGKSSVANAISETLGWDLITITPSDFLSTGPSNVEAKAKSIFKCLMEQENKVVLFDEIDHLIMDRDNPTYSEQDDVFQFMTPSMLVKLKDLRDKAKVIFIIATNYEDRIDLAIKRIGRIDRPYLLQPPNRQARLNIIKRELKERIISKEQGIDDSIPVADFVKGIDIINTEIVDFLEQSSLYTYGELKMALQESLTNTKEKDLLNIFTALNKYRKTPAISILAYYNRFKEIENAQVKEKVNQQPFDEFLVLLFLSIESRLQSKFVEKNKKVILRVLNSIFERNLEKEPLKTQDEFTVDSNVLIPNEFAEIKKQLLKFLEDEKIIKYKK